MPDPRSQNAPREARQTWAIPKDFDIISDTSEHTGAWYAIQLLGATFPDDETSMEINSNGKNLSALNTEIPAGGIVYGLFSKITLTGGKIIAYKG